MASELVCQQQDKCNGILTLPQHEAGALEKWKKQIKY